MTPIQHFFLMDSNPLAGVIPPSQTSPETQRADSNPLAGVIPELLDALWIAEEGFNPLAGVILKKRFEPEPNLDSNPLAGVIRNPSS